MVALNQNRFEHHRLSLTEVSQIVTEAMRDARQHYSEWGFQESQGRKCRRSSVVRGIAAQQRTAEVRAARMAGGRVEEVAHAVRLSCRRVSRIAPLRRPRTICGAAHSLDPRGQRGWLMSFLNHSTQMKIDGAQRTTDPGKTGPQNIQPNWHKKFRNRNPSTRRWVARHYD